MRKLIMDGEIIHVEEEALGESEDDEGFKEVGVDA